MIPVRTLLHRAPGSVEWADWEIAPPGPGEVLVETRCSAISPGTESLIFRGEMPRELEADATLASLRGGFDYPFRYGYALAGEVTAAGGGVPADWIGRRVFAFHPHQSAAVVAAGDCLPLPAAMPFARAVFLPNMETALGFAMDSGPRIGERAMVFGLGIVGLLSTALLSRFPLFELIAADPVAARRSLALDWGAGRAIDPLDDRALAGLREQLFRDGDGLDWVLEVSGCPAALNQAIGLTGFDGRIFVGSWYGAKTAAIDLGSHFHRRRVRLISSQVSRLDPGLTGRWSKQRRLDLAMNWLDRLQPERLISHRFGPADCQAAFQLAADPGAGAVQIVFDYS